MLEKQEWMSNGLQQKQFCNKGLSSTHRLLYKVAPTILPRTLLIVRARSLVSLTR